MALVKCPDCGKMVSTNALSCPACGCLVEFFDCGSEMPVAENLSEDSKNVSTEYRENEDVLLRTQAKKDDKKGVLMLLKDYLVFEGENPKDSQKIPISSIKKVEKSDYYFQISVKGKFLLISFYTPITDIWVRVLNDAMNGKYEKLDYDEQKIQQIVAERKETIRVKAAEAEEYIIANFSLEDKRKAVDYYKEYVGVSSYEAKEAVRAISKKLAPAKPVRKYPGTKDLDQGFFRGNIVVFFSGDDELGYLILTEKELIDIDTKKNEETVYDVCKISYMRENFLGMSIRFRYSGKFLDIIVSTKDFCAARFISEIKKIQKSSVR